MTARSVPFLEVFEDESGGNIKTPQSEYQSTGRFAVVDQGKSLIAGYVNDESRLCGEGRPAIVFGDHTRCVKYVDFPFCMGADGVKILRPKIEADLKYLYYFLRQLDIPNAGYDRHFKYLKRTEIVLPPVPEQRRIVAILDQADALRAKRREALAQLDSLTQSIFIEMFGDERIQGGRWPVARFEEIVSESRIGLVRGSQELDAANPYPYLRMNAITREGDLRLEGALHAQATDEEVNIYRLQRGDFLFNTRNSRELVGKTALFRSDELYLFNNNLLRVRFTDAASPEYVLAAFKTQFIQGELEVRKSGTTNVYAVYYKDLRTLPVPLPPIQLQETFTDRVHAIELLRATHLTALAELEDLFASLQHRAFRGEL